MSGTFLSTQRLNLNYIEPSDFDKLAEHLQDVAVMYAWEHAFSDGEITAWIQRRLDGYRESGYDYFLAVKKDTGECVGQIGLLTEEIEGEKKICLGWILARRHMGNGYATEGAKALLSYAVEKLGAHGVYADIRPENESSAAVATRVGMEKRGGFFKRCLGREVWHDLYVYEPGKNVFK